MSVHKGKNTIMSKTLEHLISGSLFNAPSLTAFVLGSFELWTIIQRNQNANASQLTLVCAGQVGLTFTNSILSGSLYHHGFKISAWVSAFSQLIVLIPALFLIGMRKNLFKMNKEKDETN
jgi:hypothetical protein